MKQTYISDITSTALGTMVEVIGWIARRHHHGRATFLDIADSTGTIQVVLDECLMGEEAYRASRQVPVESAVNVSGYLRARQRRGDTLPPEVAAASLTVISQATKQVSPSPRSRIDIFNDSQIDHLLRNRHLYIRNPRSMAILRFRHLLMAGVHQWFRDHRFVEITAPVLTTLPLYDDRSVMSLEAGGEKAYLTQCVGFYLEAAVHAFERVYNIGPSFRGEESRSKRHLMEYWHIKGEMAFADFEDIISLVETLLGDITEYCSQVAGDIPTTLGRSLRLDARKHPFPRMTYRAAIAKAQEAGHQITFGQSLSSVEEELLSREFDGPFWITGIPRTIEPFPYVIDPDDPEVTRTADLILNAGYGELLGVAEKIPALDELDVRMAEKGKANDPRYEWLRELRQHGCVPHVGFGMGVERLIRWMLDIPHVRDGIPFPRIFRRRIYP